MSNWSSGFVHTNIAKSTAFQTSIYLTIIIVMTNLNALVDFFIHPVIPYFDKEHLIVGGITGFVSIVLFGLLFIYMRHLDKALNTIIAIESILPICSNCKKIRKTDSDPKQMDSWQPIEFYITQKFPGAILSWQISASLFSRICFGKSLAFSGLEALETLDEH